MRFHSVVHSFPIRTIVTALPFSYPNPNPNPNPYPYPYPNPNPNPYPCLAPLMEGMLVLELCSVLAGIITFVFLALDLFVLSYLVLSCLVLPCAAMYCLALSCIIVL
jgi:hypothetical protein